MKNILFTIILFCFIVLGYAQTNPNHVKVKGYHRSDGTYVEPYYRTAPNSTNRDNFSTLGNTNPYTGKPGYILPDNNPLPIYSTSNYSSTIHENNPNLSGKLSNGYSDLTTNYDLIYNLNSIHNSIWSAEYSSNLYDSKPSYITTTTLNMREGMSTFYAVITRIPKGEDVKVINSFFGDWWEVYYNGKKGYVSSQYLSENIIQSSNKCFNNNYGSNYSSIGNYKLTDITSLRIKPDSQSSVILRFNVGDNVEVINSSDEWWWEVIHNGKRGWVKRRLLKKD